MRLIHSAVTEGGITESNTGDTSKGLSSKILMEIKQYKPQVIFNPSSY